jgi:pimeloyl-ACP methyl ester carboxylesterase
MASHSSPLKSPTLLFVSGAFHGSWCWSNFISYFESSGIRCQALEYRDIDNKSSLDCYLSQLHEAISALDAPIVIAHSMGAYVVARYAEKYSLNKVILLAPMPFNGWMGSLLRFAVRWPRTSLKACMHWNVNLLLEDESLLSDMFFSRIAANSLRNSLIGRLQPESTSALIVESNLRHISIQRLRENMADSMIVGSEDDPLFRIQSTEQTARKIGARFLRLRGFSHDMMLDSDWGLVAAEIYSFVMNETYSAPGILHGNQANTPNRNLQHLARSLRPFELKSSGA